MNSVRQTSNGTPLFKWGLPIFVSAVYLFLYLPIIILVIFSFNSAPFPAPWVGFSTKWYYELFNSSAIWHAFYTSAIVALSATALSLFMCLGIIYFLVMGGKLKRLLLLFYGNVIIPEIVLAVGLLNFLTFLSIPLGILTLIVAHTVLGLGYVVPLVYSRFLTLDIRIIESSLDLGATPTQTFFKIILPSLRPALVASSLLVFIMSFDDFVLSFFCSSSDVQTLPMYIYSILRSGVSPVVNALSAILLGFSGLLVLIFCSLNIKTKIF